MDSSLPEDQAMVPISSLLLIPFSRYARFFSGFHPLKESLFSHPFLQILLHLSPALVRLPSLFSQPPCFLLYQNGSFSIFLQRTLLTAAPLVIL